MIDFRSDSQAKAVVANEEADKYYFTDVCDQKYEWIGELKSEFAQGVANEFASELSRVALNKSEWLRRHEKRETKLYRRVEMHPQSRTQGTGQEVFGQL